MFLPLAELVPEGDDTPRPSQLKPCMAVPPLDTLTIKTASNAHTDTSVAKHTGKFVELVLFLLT